MRTLMMKEKGWGWCDLGRRLTLDWSRRPFSISRGGNTENTFIEANRSISLLVGECLITILSVECNRMLNCQCWLRHHSIIDLTCCSEVLDQEANFWRNSYMTLKLHAHWGRTEEAVRKKVEGFLRLTVWWAGLECSERDLSPLLWGRVVGGCLSFIWTLWGGFEEANFRTLWMRDVVAGLWLLPGTFNS